MRAKDIQTILNIVISNIEKCDSLSHANGIYLISCLELITLFNNLL